MYESGAKVRWFPFAGDKICFKDIQKSFTATKMLAMNDYLCLSDCFACTLVRNAINDEYGIPVVTLFHSSIFHFFPLLVILLAFACWRLSEGNLYDSSMLKAAGDGVVKSIHVLRKESLADSS